MSRGMSAAMVAECRSAEPALYHMVDLALQGGTRRWSDTVLMSDSLGPYLGKILEWGGELAYYDVADRNYSLNPIELQITVSDADKDFSNYVESANGATLLSSPPTVTIKLISPNVVAASWFTLFTGLLIRWEFPHPNQIKLYFRTNTARLEAPFARLIAPGDFPYADRTALAEIAPLLYGTHDSGGEKGQVPTLLIDVTRNRFLVAVGYLKSVDRVYIAGVQQSSGFTITHPIVNGRVYTCIEFTTTPTGDVTADVTGYETNGDGTGTLIDNPADELKHFLANFDYGDYMSGSPLADATAPVDTTKFSAANTFLSRYSHKGSRRISGADDQKAIDIFNEWCQSLLARAWWSNLGLVAVGFEDLDVPSLVLDDPWLIGGKNCDQVLERSDDTLELITRVEATFLYSERQGKFVNSLMIQDNGGAVGAPAKLAFPWSYAGQ